MSSLINKVTSVQEQKAIDAIKQNLEFLQQTQNELQQSKHINKTTEDKSKHIELTKNKVNKIFDDLSAALNVRKQIIMTQIDSLYKGEMNNKNDDKINNKNDDKKDMEQENNNNLDIKQKSDEHYDYLSIWIKNKQSLEYIDINKLELIQHDIIENVFGGIVSLLKQMLIHPVILDINHANKLYMTLSSYSQNGDDLFSNYRNRDRDKNKLSITSIPDDCLSYIMKFLGANGRYIIQQICRLFAVTARKQSSLNEDNIERDLSLMGMVPQISNIVQGIESNDKTANILGMQLYAKYMEKYEGEMNIFLIRGYWSNLWQKFVKMVLKDTTGLGQKIAIKSGVHTMYPAVMKILKYAQYGSDDDDDDDNMNISQKCGEIVREMAYEYNANVIMGNKETIPLLCKLLRNDDIKFDDDYDKKTFRRNICKAIANIIKFEFFKYNQMFIDNNLIDIICHVVGDMDIKYEDAVWNIFTDLVKTKHINIDLILSKSQLIEPLTEYPENSIRCLLMVLKHCNHQQRMEIIELLKKNSSNYGMMMNNETKDKLSQVLISIKDEQAFNKLKGVRTSD